MSKTFYKHKLSVMQKWQLKNLKPDSYKQTLSVSTTCLLRPPVCYDHLSFITTCMMWPHVCCDHMSVATTCLLWPHVCCDHLSDSTTCLLRPPVCHNHLSVTTTCLLRPPTCLYILKRVLAWMSKLNTELVSVCVVWGCVRSMKSLNRKPTSCLPLLHCAEKQWNHR